MATTTPLSWLLLQALQADLAQVTGAPNWRSEIGTLVSLEREQTSIDECPQANLRVIGWQESEIATLAGPARNFDVRLEIAIASSVIDAQQKILEAAEDVHELYRLPRTITLSANAEARVTATAATVLEQPEGLKVVICSIQLDCQCIEST